MAKFNMFGKEKEEDEDKGQGEAKFASKEDFEEIKKSSTETKTTLESLANTIKAMNDREEAKQTKLEEETRKKETKPALTAEEQFEEFANDPTAFINKRISPTTKLSLMNTSKALRMETLGGKEYYHGEFRKKVDALIDSTNDVNQTVNPAYIENCYKIVLADSLDDIQQGKLKKQLSMSTESSASGERSIDPNAKPSVEYRDAKTKYAAAQMGLTDDDVVSAAKDQAIHGLEVVA
jgi:hypothetical protein